MPVTSITKDPEALTITVVADFAATVERLWDAYVDPRQIERFWGPPDLPAQFLRHDATTGGRSVYRLAVPDGEHVTCYWDWVSVDPHRSFEVRDGDPEGGTDDRPGRPGEGIDSMLFVFEATATGSRLTTTTRFESAEGMATMLRTGMEEGAEAAMGQIDGVLADLHSFATEVPAHAQILGDTQVRVSRIIRGTQQQVWRAHHEPALLQRWLLGPDGWTMPVCRVATTPGESYRYEWEKGEERFGFEGELLESAAPYRSVTTERPIDLPVGLEGSVNELTLTPVDGGTLLTLLITYPSAEVRDMVLATGMTGGMETSYRRLETQLLAPA